MNTFIRLFHQSAKAELRVELLQVLLRHGERTPREKEMWPKDPIDVSTYEPWGPGQLINKGKMTEYRIGKMLRKRYDEFLGDVYHPSDVYAQSTDIDRTKMSLQLVLAALYPPNANQTWNSRLSWMPIPIQYIPERVDHLMKPDFSPVYLKALQNARRSKEILEKVSKYEDFFKFLREKTGANVTNTKQAYEIYNLLTAQKSMDLTLPEWVTNEVYTKMQRIVKLEYEIRSYTAEMRRLNGGPLIKQFIDNVRLNEERARPRKIYLYSGHETNIAGFVRAHNFTEPELPNYGTAIILEKLRDEAGKPFVRMLLWSGITEELTTYKFNDSDEICSFEKYKKFVNDAVPSEKEMYHIWDHISKADLPKLFEETRTSD
ncbi:venom acid phosphatase Acph-1 isoform X2 [Lasioglossum baleicum]|uniref:venom acid phosphatase Acph-1 isoform X2 n=1 Tax=Lasioglossum baleicum TaxID=434251 RepID=UPI003FCCDCC4